ncbi:MAG: ZPR1 zinc finger domain-containing protein [Nanoarchaeota archaeon]|nr:ZPR1 zinc finger domain-containing protein [Nanoarchaeota archaeon]
MAELKAQQCPFCGEKKMVLREEDMDIPYFGKVFVFSMECEACGTKKSDVEPMEPKEPCRYTLEVTSEDDLNIRVVKSGEATVKIPHVITMEPGPASSGYVTNVEGLLQKVKEIVQSTIDVEDDEGAAKKAKNMVKKLNRVMAGQEPIKIIIEDPSGHSAIISDKAQKSKI